MNGHPEAWGLLRKLTWQDALLVLAVLLLAHVLVSLAQWMLRHAAETASPHLRLGILRVVPIARLLIRIAAVVLMVSILVEPTFRNIVGLLASIGLVLAFALKDYGVCQPLAEWSCFASPARTPRPTTSACWRHSIRTLAGPAILPS
jgi:hypothetical protein